MNALNLSKDVQEFLKLLAKYQVKYVIVGGIAVIYYGFARLTGDIDLFYEATTENVDKLYKALEEFWNGNTPGITRPEDLLEPGVIVQFGIIPNRIDLINEIEGVEFAQAWLNRKKEGVRVGEEEIPIYFIGLAQLIQNKRNISRYKDLEDLKYLMKIKKQK